MLFALGFRPSAVLHIKERFPRAYLLPSAVAIAGTLPPESAAAERKHNLSRYCSQRPVVAKLQIGRQEVKVSSNDRCTSLTAAAAEIPGNAAVISTAGNSRSRS